MNRFFCPNPVILNGAIVISSKDKVHHIKRVLCLKPQEEVVLFDNSGTEYFCSIEKMGQEITLLINNKRLSSSEKKVNLTIACAMPKNAKFDDIVDKLTQLGVSRIIPLKSKRVVVKLDKKKAQAKALRWRRIAESASQQSQRRDIPVIEPVNDFKEFLASSKNFDLKLIPTLSGKRKSLREIFSLPLPVPLPMSRIVVAIGPEGDFSDDEIASAKEAGFIPLSLGQFVLRVDTASIAIAGFIRFYAHH